MQNTARDSTIRAPKKVAKELTLQYRANKTFIYVCFALYSAFLVSIVKENFAIVELTKHLPTVGILLTPYLYLLTRPGLFRAFEPLKLIVQNTTVVLPAKRYARQTRAVPLADILGIVHHRSRGRNELIIEQPKSTLHIPSVDCDSAESLSRFYKALCAAIAQNDAIHAKQLELRNVHTKGRLQKIPLVTTWLSLLLVAVFWWQQYITSGADFLLPGVGANSTLLLVQGQWFRLISSAFLHAGPLHLMLNLLGLFTLGYVLENCLGGSRILVVFTLCTLLAAMVSGCNGTILSVGASAGIFALLGNYFFLHRVAPLALPVGLRMSSQWWLYFLLLNILVSYCFPKIDWIAHLVGFFGGVIVLSLLLRVKNIRGKILYPAPGATLYMSASIAVLIIIAALAQNMYRASDPLKRDRSNVKVLNALVFQETVSSTELNDFAWQVAVHPSSTTALLELAEKAVLKALYRNELDYYFDTLATVWFRQGKVHDAIAIQTKLISRTENEKDLQFFASQLVRFVEKNAEANLSATTRHSPATIESVLLKGSSGVHLITARDEQNREVIVLVEMQDEIPTRLAPLLQNFSELRYVQQLSIQVEQPRVRIVVFEQSVRSYPIDEIKPFKREDRFPEPILAERQLYALILGLE